MTLSFLPNLGKGRNRVASGIFRALTLSLLFAAIVCIPAVADPVVQITQCGTVISQPGHYILANDLNCGGPVVPVQTNAAPSSVWGPLTNPFDGSTIPTANQPSSGDGIDIVSDHVELSLNGFTINGNGSGFSGIAVGVGTTPGNAHVHIVGPGTITGFLQGVFFLQVTFSSVTEVTGTNNEVSFFITGLAANCSPACDSAMNDFQGNTATDNFAGFFLQGASNNAIRGNTLSVAFVDIFLVTVDVENDVRLNTATNAIGGIVLEGPGVTDNNIFLNTAQNNAPFDLFDANPNCDSNRWKNNTFTSANQSCIN